MIESIYWVKDWLDTLLLHHLDSYWWIDIFHFLYWQNIDPVAALYTPLGDVEEIFNPLGVSLGQVRVKVLSPNPQLLRLGQLLAKPRGVVPNKNTKAFKLSTRKINLGVYCFLQTIDHLTKININIHSPRYNIKHILA